MTHPYRWNKMSVAAALGYRWDGRCCRLCFQTKSGNYNTLTLIGFLKLLKRHFRGRKLILIWDRLNGHRSHVMKSYLAQQRSWLRVEFLPPYAPDLNPVETLWGNVKGQELANLEVDNVLDMADDFRKGLARARRNNLGFAFLAHAGLSFG